MFYSKRFKFHSSYEYWRVDDEVRELKQREMMCVARPSNY
jgi:hypothetical protein